MTKIVRSSRKKLTGPGREQTRDRIFRAAGHLFGRVGFRKTTITDIAEAAGIGKATVYLYFQDKKDLFASLVQKETATLIEQIRAAVDAEQTVGRRLRAFILTRYRSIHSVLELHQAASSMLLEDLPGMREATAHYSEQELALVEAIFEDAQASEELSVCDGHLAAVAVTGTLRSLDQPWIFQRAPIDLEKRVDDLIHLFLYGLIARKDTA